MAEGLVIIPSGTDIWPHELKTANILAEHGKTVRFVRRTEGNYVKSADIEMDGVLWEMKSPRTNQIKYIQRILRRASKQSANIIIDTSRLQNIDDQQVERELKRLRPLVKTVKRLLLINKAGKVIDIH